MGIFYVACKIDNAANRRKSAVAPKLLVDTGSECTWVPTELLEKLDIKREKKTTFVTATGQPITRNVGFAVLHVDKSFTIDEVVFAEKNDLLLLGARTLEGLNLRVDSGRKKLVAGGPLPAASAMHRRRV